MPLQITPTDLPNRRDIAVIYSVLFENAGQRRMLSLAGSLRVPPRSRTQPATRRTKGCGPGVDVKMLLTIIVN